MKEKYLTVNQNSLEFKGQTSLSEGALNIYSELIEWIFYLKWKIHVGQCTDNSEMLILATDVVRDLSHIPL